MDAKTAVQLARTYLEDLFAGEQITNLGLEEVRYVEPTKTWDVTIGFSRPWEHKNALTVALGASQTDRSYKVINLNDSDGRVNSLKDRILESTVSP